MENTDIDSNPWAGNVELLKGGEFPRRAAVVAYRWLEFSQEHRPHEFQILVDLWKERLTDDQRQSELYKSLQRMGRIDASGQLTPLYRAIFDSSAQELGDGQVDLRPPCKAQDPESLEQWYRWEDRYHREALRFIFTDSDDSPPLP